MSLKSKYSQRFYELGCQYRNKETKHFFLDMDNLREMFCLGKGYKLKSDIKKRVIDVATAELKKAYENDACDLWPEETKEEGKGEKTRFWFFIHTKSQIGNEPNLKELEVQLVAISRTISSVFKNDKNFCKQIIEHLQNNLDQVPLVHQKLIRKIDEATKRKEHPGALIRYILEEDFGIVSMKKENVINTQSEEISKAKNEEKTTKQSKYKKW